MSSTARNFVLLPSKANPQGRDWSQLDFQARRDVIRERETELRLMHDNIIGEAPQGAIHRPRVVVGTTTQGGQSVRYDDGDQYKAEPHPLTNQVLEAQETKAQPSTVDRFLTSQEMHSQEKKCAEKMQMCLQHFIDYPTPHNWEKFLLSCQPYQTAWMNGRTRHVLSGLETIKAAHALADEPKAYKAAHALADEPKAY